MTKQKYFLAIVPTLFGICCGGGGGEITMEGFLRSLPVAGTQSDIAGATIDIQGRSAGEFESEIAAVSATTGDIRVKDLPKDESIVFRISGTALATVITQPVVVDRDTSLFLPVISSQAIGNLINVATQAGGVMFNQSIDEVDQGMIIGSVSPEGQTCSTILTVRLTSSADGSIQDVDGPFYLSEAGAPTSASSFMDTQCRFVMFNVSPGKYNLVYASQSGEFTVTVIVLAGRVTVPFRVPTVL